MKGFKEFLFQGDVIDLAVAFVIGAAFTAVVKAFVDNIITPLLNAIGGAKSPGLGFRVNGQLVDIGACISALITFVLTAALVYFLFVVPYKKFRERRGTGTLPTAEPTEVELLAEIRDSLRAGR